MTYRCKSCAAWEESEYLTRYHKNDPGSKIWGYCHIRSIDCFPTKTSEDWCLEHTLPKKAKPKTEKPKNTDHQDVIDHYYDEFVATFGRKPTIGDKDAATVKRMLTQNAASEIMGVITEFFADPPEWNRKHGAYNLLNIPGAWNAMTARMARDKDSPLFDETAKIEAWIDGQAEVWIEHPEFPRFEQYVRETRELLTFEEWLEEHVA